jgi:sucrose phosphorylase
VEEVDQAVRINVVQRLLKLIRFRNEYPAFNGDFRVLDSNDSELLLSWQKSDMVCRLKVDLNTAQAKVEYVSDTGEKIEYRV